MLNADDILRAQARALIRVLTHYKLARVWGGAPKLIWRAIEAYGTESASDLPTIHRDFYSLALAASSIGLKHRALNAPLFLALHTFAGDTNEFRFPEPAWWVAVTVAFLENKPVPEPALQGEVLKRLESSFEAEISARYSWVPT